MSKIYLLSSISVGALASAVLSLNVSPALANCAPSTPNIITCTSGDPNPYPNQVGNGAGSNGQIVNVESGTINAGDTASISLGDNANITVSNGATVTNATTPGGQGNYPGGGPNTIEFNNNGTLLVEKGGTVSETGSSGSAEAVNVMGGGNTITNYGHISAESSAAIWFQDDPSGVVARNKVDNYGIISTATGGGLGSVIGASGNNGIDFINETGANVEGSIAFAGGDDSITLYTGSSVTGSINGGGGNNSMVLAGTDSDVLQGPINNFSTLTKQDSGMWTLIGTMQNNGDEGVSPLAVHIERGTLAVGDAAHTGATLSGTVTIDPAGTLAGYGTINGDVSNNGTVAVASALEAFRASPMSTLTINGNYDGAGNLVVRTTLGDDGSPTDMLHITGNATGDTAVTVINAGGLGAATTNGIKIVQVDGISDPNAFHLGSAVAVGAYDYSLNYQNLAGTDQNWYLRSTNLYDPSAQGALPYADILGRFANATLGTLQQRTGNRIWNNGVQQDPVSVGTMVTKPGLTASYTPAGASILGNGAWGRVGGQYTSIEPKSGSSYTFSLGFLQAGYEGVAYETPAGDLTTGVYATVGTSRSRIDVTNDPVTGAARAGGRINLTGYGLGANLTWLGSDGFYADAVGQLTFYNSSLSNKPSGNNQGWAGTASLEVGKRFDISSEWAVVPQAQLVYTRVNFDSFKDVYGNHISLGDGDSLNGRLGIRLENSSSWKNASGKTDRLQYYGIANLTYDFLRDTSVVVAGTEIQQQNKRLWGEVGVGATYVWNDNWSVYAEADYATALSSGSNYTVKGSAGLRYVW